MVDKVAIYLRKSRDEDNEAKEETLARHEKMLNDYCKRNKLNVVAIYKEVVSGESIANRPEMQRLLEDVNLGLYTGVVCVEIERLSRGNQIDQCEILEVFKKSNTKIYTLQKIYDLIYLYFILSLIFLLVKSHKQIIKSLFISSIAFYSV